MSKSSLVKLLINNQMKLVQYMSKNNNESVIIQVPVKPQTSQWNLVGMHALQLNPKKNRRQASYYDGYQLYVTPPINKKMKYKWKVGPDYKEDPDDKTFVHNKVF